MGFSIFKKEKKETPQELYEKYGWNIVQCLTCSLIKNHPSGTNPLSFMKCPRCNESDWKIIKE